jgi:hypothetical protein
LALQASNANVNADSYDFPLIAAAGMCLAQPDHIADLYVHPEKKQAFPDAQEALLTS